MEHYRIKSVNVWQMKILGSLKMTLPNRDIFYIRMYISKSLENHPLELFGRKTLSHSHTTQGRLTRLHFKLEWIIQRDSNMGKLILQFTCYINTMK